MTMTYKKTEEYLNVLIDNMVYLLSFYLLEKHENKKVYRYRKL